MLSPAPAVRYGSWFVGRCKELADERVGGTNFRDFFSLEVKIDSIVEIVGSKFSKLRSKENKSSQSSFEKDKNEQAIES